MDNSLNFDTVDILAAALGAMAAFSILPIPANQATERIVVCLFVFVAVTMKRKIFPTNRANPDSSRTMRMIYLLISLIGTSFLVVGLFAVLTDIEPFRDPQTRHMMLFVGFTTIACATYIDRRYLKLNV